MPDTGQEINTGYPIYFLYFLTAIQRKNRNVHLEGDNRGKNVPTIRHPGKSDFFSFPYDLFNYLLSVMGVPQTRKIKKEESKKLPKLVKAFETDLDSHQKIPECSW